MEARLNLMDNALLARVAKAINSANRVLSEATLPAVTQELVKLRASQINGCGYCTDMHYKEAVHAGEAPEKLNMVAA